MEMRLLTRESERDVFATRLADARAQHGASFRDVGHTHARNMIRLRAADLYALFETACDHAERMTAGVAIHDLETSRKAARSPTSRITRLDQYWNAATIGRCREAPGCMHGAVSRFRSFDATPAQSSSTWPLGVPITPGSTRRWVS